MEKLIKMIYAFVILLNISESIVIQNVNIKFCTETTNIFNMSKLLDYCVFEPKREICEHFGTFKEDDEFYEIESYSQRFSVYYSNDLFYETTCSNVNEVTIPEIFEECVKGLPLWFEIKGSKIVGFLTKRMIVRYTTENMTCNNVPDFYMIGGHSVSILNKTINVIKIPQKLSKSNVSYFENESVSYLDIFYRTHLDNTLAKVTLNLAVLVLLVSAIVFGTLKKREQLKKVLNLYGFFKKLSNQVEFSGSTQSSDLNSNERCKLEKDAISLQKSECISYFQENEKKINDDSRTNEIQIDKFIINVVGKCVPNQVQSSVNEPTTAKPTMTQDLDKLVLVDEIKTMCNCKGLCKTRKCPCRLNNINCGNNCHSGITCSNI